MSVFTEDQLSRLGRLTNRQLALEKEIEALEEKLKSLQTQHRTISEIDIPSILDETGLSEVRLSDGTKVVIREDIRVSTTGKNREKINFWLERKGYDDIIKDEVVAGFRKGEGSIAEKAILALTELGAAVDRKRYVNPQTFAALLRELLSSGEDVPLDELGVFIQKRARLYQK